MSADRVEEVVRRVCEEVWGRDFDVPDEECLDVLMVRAAVRAGLDLGRQEERIVAAEYVRGMVGYISGLDDFAARNLARRIEAGTYRDNARTVAARPDSERGGSAMAHETQKTIVEWADSVFGKAIDPEHLWSRMWDEIDEMERDHAMGRVHAALQEAADVYITMVRWLAYHGVDLHAEVDRKMAINRARKWQSNGDGTGRHIKETS